MRDSYVDHKGLTHSVEHSICLLEEQERQRIVEELLALLCPQES